MNVKLIVETNDAELKSQQLLLERTIHEALEKFIASSRDDRKVALANQILENVEVIVNWK